MKNYLKYGVSAIALLAMPVLLQAQTKERQMGPQGGGNAYESQQGHEGGSSNKSDKGSSQEQKPSGQAGRHSSQAQSSEHKSQLSQEESGRRGEPGREQGKRDNPQGKSVQKQGERQGKQAEDSDGMRGQRETQMRNNSQENARSENNRSAAGGQKGNERNASVNINVTPQEKTRIHSIIENDRGIRKYNRSDIHFSLDVGTRVPDSIVFYDPPPQLISVEPDFGRYKIIILDDVILVIDPATREIVDVVEV